MKNIISHFIIVVFTIVGGFVNNSTTSTWMLKYENSMTDQIIMLSRNDRIEIPKREILLNPEKKDSLSSLLLANYRALFIHSSSISDYGITEKTFEPLFWEGAARAIEFYRSNESVQEKSINKLIASDLQMNTSLGHAIKTPSPGNSSIKQVIEALDQFSGQWHGMWKRMKVHHLWLPVVKHKKSISNEDTLIGFQSCFTGDGIGWNYIVKRGNKIVILGFVYHFGMNGRITAKNPHFAYLNSNNHITWVSDDHIYLESVCRKSNCIGEEHYIITGGKYEKNPEELIFVEKFQTTYLRNDRNLPQFIDLPE